MHEVASALISGDRITTAAPPVLAPMLTVNGITKRFPIRASWRELARNPFNRNYRTVLDDVSFEVAEGEFFGLLGQNGAGKTTLFRILSTLVLPDGGSATVAGVDAASDGAAVRHMVAPVIANERSLYWRLDARENLRLFAVLQGIRAADVQREIDRVLGVVRLTDTRHELVGTFSSGMRQRLLIARALLGTPRVLLLDEPTRSLDPISSRDFRVFLRDVVIREQGCTVLLATHDAEDVWNLCDRVGVLHLGRLLAVERTGVLRQRTADNCYRLLIRTADLPRLTGALASQGARLVANEAAAEPGWENVTASLPATSEGAAAVLAAVTDRGIPVAAFERVTSGLADLIERVVGTGSGSSVP